jgi:glycosyltransferase involved in cell wall biosynthesis
MATMRPFDREAVRRARIWLLQTGELLPLRPDARRMRTAMLAETLASRGHTVTWWASAFNHLRKEWTFQADTDVTTDSGIRIRALSGVGYSRNLSLMRWLDYRKVAGKFRRMAPAAPRPDVIVASMPGYDLANAAVSYARANGVPVLVDVRDQWPESFLDPLPAVVRPLGRAVLAGETRVMRRCLAGADGLVSMSESLLEWGLQQAGRARRESDGVFYLGAQLPSPSAKPSSETPSAALAAALARAQGKFVVAFVGTFARYHNPTMVVQAAQRVKSEGFHFIVAGDGQLHEAVTQAARGLDNVDLPGWLDQADIDTLLANASAGVCPTEPGVQRPFFPNKVFAYLAAGLPVVSAFPGEVQSMLERHGAGIHFSDVDGLVAALRRLKDDDATREAMSAAARALFAERFDATRTYEAYADHVESLIRRRHDG